MCLTRIVPRLITLLFLALLACQHPDALQETSIKPNGDRTNSYLFTGSPGIRTTSREDITGTMTGTIGGQPISFGPDKAIPVQANQGYDLYSRNPSFLLIRAQNDQYNISLSFNGPFDAGRSYRSYDPAEDNGERKFDSYIVTAYIRPPVSVMTREIIDLATPDKQVRITAITADYIDIEFLFTLKQPGATQERITIRVKNVLDENRNLRTQSEGEPYWDYTNVSRRIEGWGYNPQGLPVTGYPFPPTTTRVLIGQGTFTTPVTDINYGGKTEQATGQNISLYQLKSPQEKTYIEYIFGTSWSATGSKQVEIDWPDFTGVGTYTGDQVNISFTNNQGNAGYWRVQPTRLASTSTKWQVDVQRVTPDVIEGTYTVVEAPLYEKKGTMTMPALVSVSGRFKVIYPR